MLTELSTVEMQSITGSETIWEEPGRHFLKQQRKSRSENPDPARQRKSGSRDKQDKCRPIGQNVQECT